jgi:glucose-6-phosphate 1-dehydrogenase
VTLAQAPAIPQDNPLLEGLRKRRAAEPCALTIFGASGDLTQRKLIPALYALAFRGLLPSGFGIVGVARTPMADDEFREKMKQAVMEHGRDEFRDDVWEELAAGMRYVATDFADDGGEERVINCLNKLDEERGTSSNRVYYLAVPPSAIEAIVVAMGKRRSTTGWTRLIVEKPFGYDLESARHLNAVIKEYFHESEIFRIDHYLGKETVQNMLVLRFANGIFEPIWNRQFVDHVQITVAESLGIEGRADYYERAGASRDIFQNHLLQLVALTAMEPPIDFSADSVRNEKVKVLKATRPGQSMSSAASTARGSSRERRCPGTGRSPASLPTRRPRPTSRPSCSSTTGGGRTHRSTSARGSGCRGGRPPSRSSSSAPRIRPSKSTPKRACVQTSFSSTSSRTRACRSPSARRCPARA